MNLLPRVSCGLQNISVRLVVFFFSRRLSLTSLLAGIALCLGLGALSANAIAQVKPMVAAGSGHSLALKSDGTVVAWGNDLDGQTDVPTGLSSVVAVAAGAYHSLAVKSDGTVWAWGLGNDGQTKVSAGLSNAVAVAGGGSHSLVLKSDGTVVAMGYNGYGQSTVPAGLSNVVAVAAGSDHSLALKSDGTVVAWGDNGVGQAGVPAGLSNVVAVAGGGSFSLALTSDGKVWAWGWNGDGETNVPAGLSNVVAVAAGFRHSLALKSDGTVVAWGTNYYGQAGVPAGLSNVVGVAAGEAHSLALKSDGTVVAWGVGNSVPTGLNLGVFTPTVTRNFVIGWNLVGNGSDAPIDVTTTFSDANRFLTVWKWIAAQSAWAFYAPSLAAQGGTVLADYVVSKGYQSLTTITGGEGYWVNAKQAGSVNLPSGNAISVATLGPTLIKGWNLVSLGETSTPKQFCDAQSSGVTTLWAWDPTNSAWYFYAPSLDANGGLSTYITSKGYLDFTANGKTLGPGVGFWVNKP